jgi:hypothetical protein
MKKKEKKEKAKAREAVGVFLYRFLEILDGESFPKIHLISYQHAQPLKTFVLINLIKGGVR